MKINKIILGQRIRKRREKLGIAQKDLAEIIDISNNHLSAIENGKEKPSLDVIVNLCYHLKVNSDYFFSGSLKSNSVSEIITDTLRLCSDEDKELLFKIASLMVERNSDTWDNENIVF